MVVVPDDERDDVRQALVSRYGANVRTSSRQVVDDVRPTSPTLFGAWLSGFFTALFVAMVLVCLQSVLAS